MTDWQPISTAPRDGTPILAANANHQSHAPVVVRWVEEPTCELALLVGSEPHWADAATASGDALYFNGLYFSHWQPLDPPPPSPEGE